jgi:hypothetical protein
MQKNKKKLWIYFLSLAFCFSMPAQAQQLGLGGMVNFTSTGVLATYTPDWKGKWTLDIGLRYFAKVKLNGNNEAGYNFYQQGYTSNFWEKFGFNTRISRLLFRYKFIQLDFMANGLLTCESRMDIGRVFGADHITGEYGLFSYVDYFKASPAFELTLGPLLMIDCSPKISCYTAVGYGLIYLNHSHTGVAVSFNNKPIENGVVENIYTGEFYETWKRGQMGGVGMEGPPMLPMISFGLKYKLK